MTPNDLMKSLEVRYDRGTQLPLFNAALDFEQPIQQNNQLYTNTCSRRVPLGCVHLLYRWQSSCLGIAFFPLLVRAREAPTLQTLLGSGNVACPQHALHNQMPDHIIHGCALGLPAYKATAIRADKARCRQMTKGA
eukprot:1785936-Amphidinium_carterae.1